jgi:two-component system sensor histidine kinase ArlS
MQIRYRITLTFTIIVTVILLLICSAIYFFSKQERTTIFKNRLQGRAQSLIQLQRLNVFDTSEIRKINSTSPYSLFHRSVYIYNHLGYEIFSDNSTGAEPVHTTKEFLLELAPNTPFHFPMEERDAVAIHYKSDNHDYYILVAAYDTERVEWLKKLLIVLFICFIAGITVVVITGYFFSLSIVISIDEIIRRINHISTEEFSLRLNTGKGKDELEKLSVTINNLLDRLQRSFDTQRRFIDNASHEMLTPLTVIHSQLDVSLQKDRTKEEYVYVMQSVRDDIKKLTLLVRSLLEIAKASGSVKGIELSPVRVDELLLRLPAEVKKISPFYDVKLQFDELPDSEDAFILYGNEHLLFSAIKNIVHNACKFSGDRTAKVTLNFANGEIAISIEDKGQGIEPGEMENIFQPFYRSDKYNKTIPGVGLGLALVHNIIGFHKGRIEVRSEVGSGSTFILSFPVEV